MKLLAVLAVSALAATFAGCKSDSPTVPSHTGKTAAPGGTGEAAPPGERDEDDEEAPSSRPPPTTIRLSTADRTSAAEKPVDIEKQLDALAASAAKKAGFTLADDGNRAELEVYYAFTVDGVPTPKADRGMLVYAVTARVRVVDDQGVGELIEGRAGADAPFVRAALPALDVAFRTLVEEAAEAALRDVALQLRYRALSLDDARAGLASGLSEERWAAARRLGELGDKASVSVLLALLEDAGPLEVGVISGVLGQLKSAEAVAPLVGLVEAVPTEVGVIIVDALAAIGTTEAIAALKKIALDHPLEAVRAAAKEQLETSAP
jgi:hypothetical protein